jgi:transcriptional regulator with XRE-family HTH domain
MNMNPTPRVLREVREGLGLTSEAAAGRAMVATRTWIKWERGERSISTPAWALFLLRSGLLTLQRLERGVLRDAPRSTPERRSPRKK